MSNLSESQLETLYFNFVHWRDTECNGMATMSVHEFYAKFKLENLCKGSVGEL